MFAVFIRSSETEDWKYMLTSTTKGLAELHSEYYMKIKLCNIAKVFQFKHAKDIPSKLEATYATKIFN